MNLYIVFPFFLCNDLFLDRTEGVAVGVGHDVTTTMK